MADEPLSALEAARYQAHLALPGIGAAGQRRLLGSRVLVLGVGGLGCPAAQYLTAAGVGSLTLVDDDQVEATNLQRQVLFGDGDLGRPKVEAAADRLLQLRSDVRIEPLRTRLGAANARRLVRGHAVVVDGSDNFATRYVVNDACVLEGVPLVTGALYRYEGQVTVVRRPGPCYRCLFRQPPPEREPCHEAGVLGPLAGIIGTIQASEAVALLTRGRAGLEGRLLVIDAQGMQMRALAVERDPECPLCGPDPRIHEPTAVTAEGGRG